MEITRIKIESFKAIKSINLKLSGVNVIIGVNNSGKSSVLQAIHTAVSASQTQVETGGNTTFAEEILRYSPTGDFSSIGHNQPLGNRVDQNRAKITVFAQSENDDSLSEEEYQIELYRGRNAKNAGINRTGNARLGQMISSISRPFSVYVPGLAGIPHFEERRSHAVVLRKLAGGEANLVFRNILVDLKDEEKIMELVRDLDAFFPGIDIECDFKPREHTHINVKIRAGTGRSHYPAELCGTGVLQAIQIFSYVILFRPTLLLLDEPDSHLHPSNQTKLVEAVNYLHEAYGTKTIIATHSRHIINAGQFNSNFIWLDNGTEKENGRIDVMNMLMDLGGLDDADLIMNNPKEFLFFTEDSNKNLIRTLLESCRISDERYEIISYHGVSNAEATAKIINSLRPFIPGDPKIIVHRDRDFMRDQELAGFVDSFKRHGCKVFITEGCDIESYFLNLDHLAALSGYSTEKIKMLLDEILLENDGEIRKKFLNKRREINRSNVNQDGGAPPTSDLCPDDQPVNVNHAVGKFIVRMIKNKSKDSFGESLDPISNSGVIISPDLVRLLS